ncbi:OmpA family protein [Mesorhizobium sp.]|uniref:OmpA family protein n=1 Tax=Mesorhizobium sp. TaxID=1871066 RepID=UPI0025D8F3B0|nr:OmpA family protein [Mesorhizobium sp.]
MQSTRLVTLLFLSCFADPFTALAQGVSSEAIVEALVPKSGVVHKPGTPGLRSLRGLEIEPAVDPKNPPSIDIRVNFAFNSAELDPDATVTLMRLGEALSDPRLQSYSFMIAGHTDAKGTDEYNQGLSEARARAVVDYLVRTTHVAERRLSSQGYGESQLIDSGNPESGENRRVQIVNLGSPE